mmetsp:Transcript_18647/g.44876  ORF Transcript_18647/g.44876 Transcript_18647/m.44876 type:complete len:260 (+) Transcript_18647:443-1222(+)
MVLYFNIIRSGIRPTNAPRRPPFQNNLLSSPEQNDALPKRPFLRDHSISLDESRDPRHIPLLLLRARRSRDVQFGKLARIPLRLRLGPDALLLQGTSLVRLLQELIESRIVRGHRRLVATTVGSFDLVLSENERLRAVRPSHGRQRVVENVRYEPQESRRHGEVGHPLFPREGGHRLGAWGAALGRDGRVDHLVGDGVWIVALVPPLTRTALGTRGRSSRRRRCRGLGRRLRFGHGGGTRAAFGLGATEASSLGSAVDR